MPSGRRVRVGVLAFAAAVALLLAPSAASARDAIVSSFDGTAIVTHIFGPTTPSPDGQAPTVLLGPTYAIPGAANPDEDAGGGLGLATLRGAGYNVVTWDPRGFGTSGGTSRLDSPAYEGRDVRAIVDWLAAQPEARLDAPGDPRVGMAGQSYGATIQLVAAALDRRIDAIAPDSGWNSLLTALFKDGAVKTTWLDNLCTPRTPSGLTGRLLDSPGSGLGGVDARLTTACLDGVGGTLTPENERWFGAIGPAGLVGRIRAPTLVMQGTPDTFFPLSEAIASFDALRAHGVEAKMVWHCGGHGGCVTPAGDPQHVVRATLAWLEHWLRRDGAVDVGPRFEWIDDAGTWRSGPDYPLAQVGAVVAAGAGTLALSPFTSPRLGLAEINAPDDQAVGVRFPAPPGGADIVGTPTVRLSYRGTADPARTFVYASVVDANANRVIGGQATPIPVVLDGRARSVERPLEAIAVHSVAGSAYRLQISSGGATYALQHSLGNIAMTAIRGTLPRVDATRSGVAASRPRRTPTAPALSVSARTGRPTARISISARLRARPCRGSVSFGVRVGPRVLRRTARLAGPACTARATVQAKAPSGTRVRVSAMFAGNAELAPRRARTVTTVVGAPDRSGEAVPGGPPAERPSGPSTTAAS